MKVMAWPLSSQAPRATMNLRPPVERLEARLERRRIPQIERIDRLHVVVTVEQHARTFFAGLPPPLLPTTTG